MENMEAGIYELDGHTVLYEGGNTVYDIDDGFNRSANDLSTRGIYVMSISDYFVEEDEVGEAHDSYEDWY